MNERKILKRKGVIATTVGTRLHTVLSSLRSAQAEMEASSLETEDQNAKQLYADASDQLGQIINSVAGRVNYVEEQEPQYKMNPRNKPNQNQNQNNQ